MSEVTERCTHCGKPAAWRIGEIVAAEIGDLAISARRAKDGFERENEQCPYFGRVVATVRR